MQGREGKEDCSRYREQHARRFQAEAGKEGKMKELGTGNGKEEINANMLVWHIWPNR